MVNREMEDNYESGLVDALKEVVVDCTWQRIGVKNELSKRRCQIIYAEDGEDLVLIYIEAEDKFYAMDSVCSHEGGPLDMGDIEELAGNWFVICPWHSFEFDVQTGQNSFGLSQNVYEGRCHS
jgi:nitrite reductase/ring-hydroxylating ferredoxin subunit